MDQILHRIARRALYALWALCLVTSADANEGTTAAAEGARAAGYVGSAECAGCHTQIHDAWQETRHAYSVLTANEARRAGYPLPPQSGEPDGIRTWRDVSWVVGGRQRIAYADQSGQVNEAAYHHRIGKWSPFPGKPMTACGACHFTGDGTGAVEAREGAVRRPPIEHDVGCEACHGPGAAHAESLEPEDVVVDPSSRSCGNCHTTAGKVLPKDDLHDTHDLVQFWNRDPHVLGLRFRSHNAFCADCHSPYERGDFTERSDGAASRVFTENAQLITCIGCHNPHELTDSRYRRDEAHLGPPLPPRRHVYRGNDRDFTTTDFDAFDSTVEVCLDCHRGADRVDLDHANATCNDCHNPFNRNREPESRPFHDANHRRLSCRPCHQDADHLLSIVNGDPDFLEPRHVHNLRTLPRAVVEKYDFAYPASRPRRWSALPADPGGLSVPWELSAAALRAPQPPDQLAEQFAWSSGVGRLLAEERHVVLGARDAEIDALQAELREAPDSLAHHLSLANGYASRGMLEATRDLLALASDSASGAYRSLLFGAGSARQEAERGRKESRDPSGEDRVRSVAALWLEGLLAMGRGQFQIAAQRLEQALALEPANPGVGLHLGLAELGSRRPNAAIGTLESVARRHPNAIAPRIALAAIYTNLGQLSPAVEHLEAATVVDPEQALAQYFLGRAQMRQRKPLLAAAAFRAALVVRPDDLNAWFHLARAYRAASFYGAAVDTYEEILRRQPGLFDAHHDLALLYKLLSDKVAMTRKRESEKARPVGVSAGEWQQYLSKLRRRAVEFGELALVAFDRAGAIKPLDTSGMRQIGEILRRAGRFAEAREQFERLARDEPTQWEHRYRLGTIAIREREDADAIAHLRGALELAPTEGDVYVALALAYARAGRTEDAIATLEQGSIYEPFNPALYTNLGAAHTSRGDYPKGRRALERAVELRTFPLPRTHLAHTNLGILHWREGHHAAAIGALEQALHIFPDYAYAATLMAAVADTDAAPDSAEPVLDDLLERFGEISTVRFPDE